METLGCKVVIFFDKLGTLTTNHMLLIEFIVSWNSDGSIQEFHYEGTNYNAEDGSILNWSAHNMLSNLKTLVEIVVIFNDACTYYQDL